MSEKLREMPIQALAYIGDAVFELMVRTHICSEGTWDAGKLHSKSISFVSAKSQAALVEKILPLLGEDELEIYKRGRNSNTRPAPKGSTLGQYHAATGIEALFGYLYLSGNIKRLNELFEAAAGI